MTAFLEGLQDSAFSAWVLGSDSIWAYPMILTVHTIGLGIVVGAAVVIDFWLLGIGPEIPQDEIKRVFPILWVGFLINLASGLALLVAEAADKATKPIFLVKLFLIAMGVVVTARVRRDLSNDDSRSTRLVRRRRRVWAIGSLALWGGAIVAGRLMAYLR